MARRWPPVLGLTGFDGGAKPAISLATRTGRLQGSEGAEGAVDRGPGACCYNDGTCDDISQFDCISAGGQWRGPGTTCADVPNPCVGACCEPGCVENTTPDGCALDGGTFQGFGTTCDPDPCPPLPPCNGCGFGAFDGSGRKFLTQTITIHVVKGQSCLDSDPTSTCERGTDATYIFTDQYASDCSLTETVDLLGDATFTGGFYEELYHNCDGTTIHDIAPHCSPSTISATEQYCQTVFGTFHHPTCTPVDTTLTVTIDVILSDECTP